MPCLIRAPTVLTRKAGAKQAVSAEFALGNLEEESLSPAKLKNLRFYVNGKDLGQVIQAEGIQAVNVHCKTVVLSDAVVAFTKQSLS